MRLWLARHARPLVETGLCYGTLDVPADEAETAMAARQLAQVLPLSVELLTSPRRRCTQLAQALTATRSDLSERIDERLAEMDFGRWEGRLWNSLERAEFDAWTADFLNHRAGGSGETAAEFVTRVGALFDEARAAGRDQCWIAHGGVFRAALLRHSGVELTKVADWPNQSLAWGQWHLFQIEV